MKKKTCGIFPNIETPPLPNIETLRSNKDIETLPLPNIDTPPTLEAIREEKERDSLELELSEINQLESLEINQLELELSDMSVFADKRESLTTDKSVSVNKE